MTSIMLPEHFQIPNRECDKVWLHCSASNNPNWDNVEAIRKYHTDPKNPEEGESKGKGWSDCGYHYFIPTDGVVQIGRPIERTPAQARGYNEGAIAVACHGLYVKDFTPLQMEAVKALCLAIDKRYKEEQNRIMTFHGHTEVANKTCPVYDYKRLLNLALDGALGLGEGIVESIDFDFYPVTRFGDQGDMVFVMQKLLDMSNCDGQYGPATKAAVKKYQKDIGLTSDGVAGPATWEELI